jgi:hypothetical protein
MSENPWNRAETSGSAQTETTKNSTPEDGADVRPRHSRHQPLTTIFAEADDDMRRAQETKKATEGHARTRREAEAASEELRRLLDVAYRKSLALLRSFPEDCRHKHEQIEQHLQGRDSGLLTHVTPADVADALVDAAAKADKGIGPGSLEALPTEGTPSNAYFRPLHFLGELLRLARDRRKAEVEEALQRLRTTRYIQEFVLWFGPVAATLCGVQRDYGVHSVPIEVPVPSGVSPARGPEYAEQAFRAVGLRDYGKGSPTVAPHNGPATAPAPTGNTNAEPVGSSQVDILVRRRLAIADVTNAFLLMAGHIWTHLSVRSRHIYGAALPDSYASGAVVPRTIENAVASFQRSLQRLQEFDPVPSDFVWLRCGDQTVTSRGNAPDLGRMFAGMAERTSEEWQREVIQPFQAAAADGRAFLDECFNRFEQRREDVIKAEPNAVVARSSVGDTITDRLNVWQTSRQESIEQARVGMSRLFAQATSAIQATEPLDQWQERITDLLAQLGAEIRTLEWEDWLRDSAGSNALLKDFAELILENDGKQIAAAVQALAKSRPSTETIREWLKRLPEKWSEVFNRGWLWWKLSREFPPTVKPDAVHSANVLPPVADSSSNSGRQPGTPPTHDGAPTAKPAVVHRDEPQVDPRAQNDIDARSVPLPEVAAPQYVTLDQAAAIINRNKKTLERYLNDPSYKKHKMPPPEVEGGGGKPHEWLWSTLRPWLEETFGRQLPDRFPRM